MSFSVDFTVDLGCVLAMPFTHDNNAQWGL